MNRRLQDIGVVLPDRPGALADFGETLGSAGISLEGGGVFTTAEGSVAHFLVENAVAAKQALEATGIGPVHISDVVLLRLDQEAPGQLGLFARVLGTAGVNIRVQYSDHDHHLVIVVAASQQSECERIATAWGTA